MTLPPGTRLGHYELVAAIGAGGMGEVFKARDTHLNRDVAIKVLPASLAGDAERLARFKREAQVLASLNHPNIAQIFGFDGATLKDGSTAHFLAMELVEGEDLSERLKRGAIPVDETIAIAKQIAEGLEEAHERGIIHRDLKPANVKVTPGGKVKVLDFGLAKALEGDPSSSGANSQLSHSPTMSRHMTEAGMIMGTAAYMSPEQARGKAVDKRADIWSFGVVLYEMLTGERLFAGETVSDVLASVLKGDLNFSALPQTAPPRFRNLIRDCLVRDPKLRLRDIGDARLALDRALVAPSTREASKPARGGRFGAALLAAVGVVALGAGLGIGRATVTLPPAPTFTPRTFVPQIIFNARFMPDGKTVILSSALNGNVPSLFELRPDSPVPRPFGPPRTHLLSVSKSGELAVLTDTRFISHRLVKGTLARMTLDSAPRAISENVREADWLPDGSDLVVIRDSGGRDQLEFPVGHVVHQSSAYLSDPRVSRDGARVAFVEHPTRFDNRGIVKVADRAGKVASLSGDFPAIEGMAWSADGGSVLFSASIDSLEVFEVKASGGSPPVAKVSSAGDLIVLDIAPDGTLAAGRESVHLGVVVRGAGQAAERELGPFDQSWGLHLSRDGAFATFSDGRGGSDYAVLLRHVDGSPPVTLGEGNAGSISHDGRWVTAAILSTGRCVVYPTGAGAPVPIPMGPLEACNSPFFFPDDKSVGIWGNEKAKAPRLYRAAFPGGVPVPLLPEGLTPWRVSESGDRFLVQDKDFAFQVFESGGTLSPVKGLEPRDEVLEWSAEGRWAIVNDAATVPSILQRVALDTGVRTRVGELGPADRAGVTNVGPAAFRDNGRIYGYGYERRVSTLFLVKGVR